MVKPMKELSDDERRAYFREKQSEYRQRNREKWNTYCRERQRKIKEEVVRLRQQVKNLTTVVEIITVE